VDSRPAILCFQYLKFGRPPAVELGHLFLQPRSESLL
jgi:hypothetical protein